MYTSVPQTLIVSFIFQLFRSERWSHFSHAYTHCLTPCEVSKNQVSKGPLQQLEGAKRHRQKSRKAYKN